MAESEIIVRAATSADADALADVDRQSWPAALAATAEQFAARIAAYAEGQLVATRDGRVIAAASAQRITAECLARHQDRYADITDDDRFTRTHTAVGEIYQLIGVGVLPEFRGRRLGRLLVDRQIERARSLAGIRRIVGFTRPARFARQASLPLDEYIAARDERGRPLDPVLGFHLNAGARVVSVHHHFRPADRDAGGCGVLIEYPLRSTRSPG